MQKMNSKMLKMLKNSQNLQNKSDKFIKMQSNARKKMKLNK